MKPLVLQLANETRLEPARSPRDVPRQGRLLVVDGASGGIEQHRIRELDQLLRRGDLLVVNDAATLPAAFQARVGSRRVELRLMSRRGEREFLAFTLGDGDWRTPTESRPQPAAVVAGERLELGPGFSATVREVDGEEPRLLLVEFAESGPALWQRLYAHGKPVQYAYQREALAIWDVQNRYAARPWAFEPPSAGLGIDFELLFALRRRGVGVASLTHAAGLSSTGSPKLDARLPLPEDYRIPAATIAAIGRARRDSGRVVAVGTSVVRALEDSALSNAGAPRAGDGRATLLIRPDQPLSVVDGLLTGLHEPGTSHYELMEAFVSPELLDRSARLASAQGFLQHEFGDQCLLLS